MWSLKITIIFDWINWIFLGSPLKFWSNGGRIFIHRSGSIILKSPEPRHRRLSSYWWFRYNSTSTGFFVLSRGGWTSSSSAVYHPSRIVLPRAPIELFLSVWWFQKTVSKPKSRILSRHSFILDSAHNRDRITPSIPLRSTSLKHQFIKMVHFKAAAVSLVVLGATTTA
jgi:hypothetical protein